MFPQRMGFFASINGHIAPAEDAKVSVLDNGFTFGDGVYETLRTYRGRPFRLDLHLRRLRNSASRLGIAIPPGDEVLGGWLDDLLARAGNPESYIRMIVTRGRGDISYHFERVSGPTIVFVVKPYEPFPETFFEKGVRVCLVSVRRNHPNALDPAIKSLNLLNNVLAIREAQARGGIEALLLNQEGELAEGASSNVFLVRHGGLLTPPLGAGILPGITREVILELAPRVGIPVEERPLREDDLFGADEAFFSSTLKEVCPIVAIDDRQVSTGVPGPVTLRLLRAFRDEASRG